MRLRYNFLVLLSVALFSLYAEGENQNVQNGAFGLHSYAPSSVLANGQWAKIRVSSTGIYKITFDDLKKMGVTNPQSVKICGYGGAILPEDFSKPFIDDLPENAIYIGSNYILFYAQGPVSWSYNTSTQSFVHTNNYYTNYGYYFVTQGTTPAKQIPVSPAVTDAPTVTVDYFLDRDVHELDQTNLAASGREFYGEAFNYTTSYTFPFTFANSDLTHQGKVNISVAANCSAASSFSVRMNTSTLGSVSVPALSSQYEFAMEGGGTFAITPASDNYSVGLTYSKPTSIAIGYLNYIEMNVYRKLIMTGNVMNFRNPDYIGQGQIIQYSLSNAGSNIRIWNLSDPQNIVQAASTISNQTLTFTSTGQQLEEYVAVDPTQSASFGSPEIVETSVGNQNLHAATAQDMVIISPQAFASQAERLAQKHRDHDKLKVLVVTPEQTYNEFSSGTPDATAYRRFMKMLFDRAAGNASLTPKYLLLFGRGCYDNRGIIPTAEPVRQLLTFESYKSLSQTASYVSDDYFGLLGDADGVNLTYDNLDIGVGRFPVYTVAQAKDAVDKTLGYIDNANLGYWKNQLCFVADDGDNNLHMTQADSIASYTSRMNSNMQINKIYLDAFQQQTAASGNTYPLAKEKMLNLIKSGLLMLNYTGHGGPAGWADEHVLTTSDIQGMYNANLPLWVTATCDFTRCDYTDVTAGEYVFLNANGGGIALFTTTRTVYSNDNYAINRQFAKNVFSLDNTGSSLRLGDIMRLTKNALAGNDNKMNFILIGDPAIKLNFPAPNYAISVDSINSKYTSKIDTINALEHIVIKGHINLPGNGGICSDFNGTVQAVIFDKQKQIKTLANDAGSTPFYYYDRPNTLFSGKAKVTAGRFTIESIIPKDIDYTFGTGKINLYASDSLGREGQGNFYNFVVGGGSNNVVWEQNGPAINMYLNSSSFKTGDKVNETPLFFASLSDATGINTIGSGIGHDMTLTLDQDPSQYYVLNNYFEPKLNDYKSGTVQYQLPALTEGKHTLTFKVWDVLNNSSDSTIEFEVVKGLAPELMSVYSYPNPVVTSTAKFVLVHDRPDMLLNISVRVYDLTGKMLKLISTDANTVSNVTEIPWDVTDASGNRLRPGIYLYKLSVSTVNGEVQSKTQKIVVGRQ
jgi:hypothetical protein